MGERPIVFSGAMVRALLAGTKTQTRRRLDAWTDEPLAYVEAGVIEALDRNDRPYRWPRTHAVGDRLWVRETWTARMTHGWTIADARSRMFQEEILYRVDEHESIDGWWPSIHMPREFSRLTLAVTEVRVERLQDISEADALAEGMTQATADAIMSAEELALYASTLVLCADARGRILYETLWDAINGPGSWEANPWIAAYTFTVAHRNIDEVST
jgi:hypothetical protein